LRIDTFRQLARTSLEIDWIIENLISPGGWTFLVGETGSGKSMLSIQLCEALQTGKEFLGFKTKKHNCLYVQADSGVVEWKKQIEMLAPESMAWTVYEVDRGWLDDPTTREQIRSLVWGTYAVDDRPMSPHSVLKHVPFDFIIFDCLHAITEGDINTKTCGSQVLKFLDTIVTNVTGTQEDGTKQVQRVHYLLIHHPNATTRRGTTAGSGWKGFSDACATKFTLGGNLLVLEKSKITGKKELLLERDKSTGAWRQQGSGLSTTEIDYNKIFNFS